jgi:ribosome-binding factor A
MTRIEKVNETIKRELGNLFQLGEIKDPRVNFITILSVDVSKDLQHARVRFSTLSDDPKDIQDAQLGLNSSRGYVRKLIAERVPLRYIPEFQFIYDKGVRYSAEIDQTLTEIKEREAQEGKKDE